MNRKWMSAVIVIVSCFGLVSCPNPLKEAMLLHVKDQIKPVIDILSPAAGSCCAKTLVISGMIRDASTAGNDAGKIAMASFEVLSTDLRGPVEVASDGSFEFRFSTSDLPLTFTVKLTAVDWNDNTGEVSRTFLRKEGDDITSFAALAENHRVTLSWDPAPLAVSYTLYYTNNGMLPSPTYGQRIEGVASPHALENLANGAMYVFLLEAHSSSGEDNWSGYRQAIPLSPYSLAPVVSGEYRHVKVEWNAIPATNTFEVYRSTDPLGGFSNITGPIQGTQSLDTAVSEGVEYYYKVKPSLAGSLMSEANANQASPFPPKTSIQTWSADTYQALGVEVKDGYLYVADYGGGVKIFDIHDPSAPFLAGAIATGDSLSNPCDVAVCGDYAYLADEDEGARIFDISDPDAARFVGSYLDEDTWPCFAEIAVRDNYVYAGSYDGIWVIDVSDPTAPSAVVKGFPTDHPYDCYGMAFQGNYLYVADNQSTGAGLRIVNIADPTQPQEVGFLPSTRPADVVVSGDYAYFADHSQGMRVVDVSNPGSPAQVPGGVFAPGSPGSFAFDGIALVGTTVYISDYYGKVYVVDVSIPAAPVQRSLISGLYWPVAIAAEGGYIFVAEDTAGITIINDNFPNSLHQVAYRGIGDTGAVCINGSYAYTSEYDNGFAVVDLTKSDLPLVGRGIIGSWNEYAGPIAASGNCIVLGVSGRNSLQVYDISNPQYPMWPVAVVSPLPAPPRGLAFRGSFVFVAESSGGLRVLDVSDPAHAFEPSGSFAATSLAMDVALQGDYAYVADYNEGLVVVDISNPLMHKRVGTRSLPGYPCAVAVSGQYAYITSMSADWSSATLYVVDVSNPSAPQLSANSISGGAMSDVSVVGSFAYLTDNTAGLRVIDISDPLSPAEVGRLAGPTVAVAVRGRYAYCATGSGLKKVDLRP
jgi:hypothetical protein